MSSAAAPSTAQWSQALQQSAIQPEWSYGTAAGAAVQWQNTSSNATYSPVNAVLYGVT